jgi:protease I
MPASPRGKRVALLVEDEFEDREFTGVRDRLHDAGCDVVVVGPAVNGRYTGRRDEVSTTADASAGSTRVSDLDAVVVPGGYAADRMRLRHAMVDLVRDAAAAGKPVAAIGHGAQLFISAGLVRGRTLTCWPSIAIDLINAGALYVDRPAVDDGGVITARKIDDVGAFTDAILRALDGVAAGNR